MAVNTKNKKKVHLSRPTNERRTMCGRSSGVEETDQPAKVTCGTCRPMYQKNKKWYAAAKRKMTAGKKK
jgi:hypothetical protein